MAKRTTNGIAAEVTVGEDLIRLIEVFYRANIPFLLDGDTGIGKSEAILTASQRLGIGAQLRDLCTLEAPDLIGLPFFCPETKCTRFAPPADLPHDATSSGLLSLEELNRCSQEIRQASLSLLTTRKLQSYELPKGWLPCTTVNPEEGDYQVEVMDAALRSRFAIVKVKADRRSWLEWAETSGVHPAIIRAVKQDTRAFVTASPRSWHYASDVVKTSLAPEAGFGAPLQLALSAFLPSGSVADVMHAVETLHLPMTEIDPTNPLFRKREDIQAHVEALLTLGRLDELASIAERVITALRSEDSLRRRIATGGFDLQGFEAFLGHVSGDLRAQMQEAFATSPATAALIQEVKPKQILREYYKGTEAHNLVSYWADDELMQHRVGAIATALLRLLGPKTAAAVIESPESRQSLRVFCDQLPEVYRSRLMTGLASRGVHVYS